MRLAKPCDKKQKLPVGAAFVLLLFLFPYLTGGFFMACRNKKAS